MSVSFQHGLCQEHGEHAHQLQETEPLLSRRNRREQRVEGVEAVRSRIEFNPVEVLE